MTLQLPQAPFSRHQCLNPITNACPRVTKKSHFSKHYHPPPPLVALQPRPKGQPRAADETVSDPWAWTTVRTLGSHQPHVLCAPFDGGIASDRRPFSFPLWNRGHALKASRDLCTDIELHKEIGAAVPLRKALETKGHSGPASFSLGACPQ